MLQKIEIVETLSRTVEVEADTQEQAELLVRQMYREERIVLSGEDFLGVEFRSTTL